TQHPDVVLDVVLSPTGQHILADSPLAIPSLALADSPNDALTNSQGNDPDNVVTDTPTSTEDKVVKDLQVDPSPAVRVSSTVYRTFIQAVKDGQTEQADRLSKEFRECHQDLKAEIAKNTELTAHAADQADRMIELQVDLIAMQEKMEQLQIHALGQLAVLQSRVQAVLTQTYKLHEYPIPRLFIVLPQDPSYGSYVLTILKMLKFGITVAGVAMPALSHLISVESIDQATTTLKQLQETIEPGVDRVIDYIDNVSVQDDGAVGEVSVSKDKAIDDVAEQVEKKEALEGTDLCKLDTFLQGTDGNKVLGNLYRIVTNEGHVKWVCVDHYRENYNKTAAEAFRCAVDSVGGSFDENSGLVKVKLRSRMLAAKFYSALGKGMSVYELNIYLDLEGTRSDLEALEDVLKKSRDLISLSNFPSRRPSHLHKLSLEMVPESIGVKEFGLLSETLKTNSTLTTLNLQSNSIGDNGAQALSEALKSNSALITLDLWSNSIGDSGAQALSEALKINSTLTTLNLQDNSIGSNGAQALSEALKAKSTLTTLGLTGNSIGDKGAHALAKALQNNSALTTLGLTGNSIGENGAHALAEALETNSTLTILFLGNNLCGENGAQALSKALKTSSTLTTLELWSNSIGDSGAQALSDALKTNSTLTTLNLGGNSIGDNGAQALAEALKTNSTLTTLNLWCNLIRENGAQPLHQVSQAIG
ncbi:hypothetical protein BGZ81_002607, partial [Podila clonocystis]